MSLDRLDGRAIPRLPRGTHVRRCDEEVCVERSAVAGCTTRRRLLSWLQGAGRRMLLRLGQGGRKQYDILGAAFCSIRSRQAGSSGLSQGEWPGCSSGREEEERRRKSTTRRSRRVGGPMAGSVVAARPCCHAPGGQRRQRNGGGTRTQPILWLLRTKSMVARAWGANFAPHLLYVAIRPAAASPHAGLAKREAGCEVVSPGARWLEPTRVVRAVAVAVVVMMRCRLVPGPEYGMYTLRILCSRIYSRAL